MIFPPADRAPIFRRSRMPPPTEVPAAAAFPSALPAIRIHHPQKGLVSFPTPVPLFVLSARSAFRRRTRRQRHRVSKRNNALAIKCRSQNRRDGSRRGIFAERQSAAKLREPEYT